MSIEQKGYNPEGLNPRPPFKTELEPLSAGENFDIHKLPKPESEVSFPDGEEKEFSGPDYAVTEYHDSTGKNHPEFVKIKHFYEAAAEYLGEYLPKSMFVEGHPSSGAEGRSFYVVQKLDSALQEGKRLDELNAKEFSQDFVQQLLDIQERIASFLEAHGEELPEGWLEEKALDEKSFKEDVVHSPKDFRTQITNMFHFDADLAKKAVGSSATYEASQKSLRVLKMTGLGWLAEKIERSAAFEWAGGKDIYWNLNPEKMRALKERGEKVMALTFDDGPNEETEKLLDILKEKDVKATFFLVGSQIPGREHIVQRIVEEGHDIGNHEWTQEGEKSPLNTKEYAKRFFGPRRDLGDVTRNNDLVESITGKRPKIGRMSGVHGTVDSLREFQKEGLKIVHAYWKDVAFMVPSETMTRQKLMKNAMGANGHGRIRLFHIGKMTDKGVPQERSEINFDKGEVYAPDETLAMIGEYIDKSREQGYGFVKVEENI